MLFAEASSSHPFSVVHLCMNGSLSQTAFGSRTQQYQLIHLEMVSVYTHEWPTLLQHVSYRMGPAYVGGVTVI